MSDFEDRAIGDLTIRIDRLLCVGFGDCVEVAPAAFELDAEGIATIRSGAGRAEREQLLEACRSCPVDALVVLDEEGRQIVP